MLEQLKQLLGKIMPETDMDQVTEGIRLVEDPGCNSLMILMLSMEIEKAFHFRFTEFVKFETVGDVCGYLGNRI